MHYSFEDKEKVFDNIQLQCILQILKNNNKNGITSEIHNIHIGMYVVHRNICKGKNEWK